MAVVQIRPGLIIVYTDEQPAEASRGNVVAVPEEAEPAGARGGGGEAGAEAALQQEARHQGRVQGHPAPRRAQGTRTNTYILIGARLVENLAGYPVSCHIA